MDDINDLINEVKAAAARRAAIARDSDLRRAREALEGEAPAPDPTDAPAGGEGTLVVERRQGQWRCYLGGQRIRSGDALEVFVNEAVGWVAGTLLWGRRPTTPPSVRVTASHPHRIDAEGRPVPVGEVELLLPEDAVCRWP